MSTSITLDMYAYHQGQVTQVQEILDSFDLESELGSVKFEHSSGWMKKKHLSELASWLESVAAAQDEHSWDSRVIPFRIQEHQEVRMAVVPQ